MPLILKPLATRSRAASPLRLSRWGPPSPAARVRLLHLAKLLVRSLLVCCVQWASNLLQIGAALIPINPGLGAAYLAAGALFTAGAGAIGAATSSAGRGASRGGSGGQESGRTRFETGGQAGIASGGGATGSSNDQQRVSVDSDVQVELMWADGSDRVIQAKVRHAQDRDAALRGA